MSHITQTTDPNHPSHRDEEGQTMAEYGVVLTVITIGIVVALSVFATGIERAILRAVALIP